MSIAKFLPITILSLVTTGCLNGPSHRMPIVGELQVRQLPTGEMCFKPDWDSLTQMGKPFTYSDKLRLVHFRISDNITKQIIDYNNQQYVPDYIHPNDEEIAKLNNSSLYLWEARLKDGSKVRVENDELCMGIEHPKYIQKINRPLLPYHNYSIAMSGLTANSKYQVGMGSTFRYLEPQKNIND